MVGLERAEAVERLLGLHERTVGGQRAAVLDADGRRGLRRLELDARRDTRRLVDRLPAGHDRLLVLLGQALPVARLRAEVEEDHVLHRCLLLGMVAVETNAGAPGSTPRAIIALARCRYPGGSAG
jgi:hypothetical protein